MEGETWRIRTSPEWRSVSREPADWVSVCGDLKKELRQTTEDLKKELRQTTEDLKKELRQTTEDLKKENHELRKHNELLKDKQNATEKEVEILKETHQMKLMVGVFPVDFRVKYDKKFYISSFYTHSSGYQMRISLHPNGCGSGKGTHASLVTQLMRGPYDDHLKWPFRGEITVQIVNQAGDHSHFKWTIRYNDKTPGTYAGRVTDKETAREWGFPFLALTDLEYNAARKTQYLKDGIIIVRVVEVIITQ